MYKAIIADDEKKICRLIQTLGDWERLNIEVVDVCYQGDEAWESIVRNRPDIVLTDIRMPGMDGLQIISKTAETFGAEQNTHFIIISGYAKFEYARQAIQHNIVNYILKPIDKAQLNEALEKACKSLRSRQLQMDNSKRLEESRRILRSSCLENLLAANSSETVSVSRINSKFGVSFQEGSFCMMEIVFPFSIANQDSFLLEKIIEQIEDHKALFDEILTRATGSELCCLFNYHKIPFETVKKELLEIGKIISETTAGFMDAGIYMGVGNPVDNLGECRKSLENGRIAEKTRYFSNRRNVFFYDPEERSALSEVKMNEILNFTELKKNIDLMSENGVKAWFRNAAGKIDDRDNGFDCKSLTLFEQIIRGRYTDMAEAPDRDAAMKNELEFVSTLNQAVDIDNYCWIMSSKFTKLIQEKTTRLNESESQPVVEAKNYVYKNYGNHITLTEVADHLNFSSVYFGNMFKKVTGISFSDFLTQVRMEKSKDLLKNTRLSVQEIAEKVGYADIKYFRKVFKQFYGMKPLDYRKLTSLNKTT